MHLFLSWNSLFAQKISKSHPVNSCKPSKGDQDSSVTGFFPGTSHYISDEAVASGLLCGAYRGDSSLSFYGEKVKGAYLEEDAPLSNPESALPRVITRRILWSVAQSQYDPPWATECVHGEVEAAHEEGHVKGKRRWIGEPI